VILAPLLALLLAQSNPDLERLKQAQSLMNQGRCSEAIPLLKLLSSRHPEAPTLAYGLGRCYFEVEDYSAAIATLRDTVKKMPKSAEVRFFLGSALGLSGNIPDALDQLRAAMAINPKFEPAFRAFGMFRVQQHQYLSDALEALRTAVRLDPRDARAQYWLGELYRGFGDVAHARQCFEQAHKLDAGDLPARLGLGQALLADGEIDQALAHFDAVLKFEPKLVPALLGRARALYDKGLPDQALAPAEAARAGAQGFEDQRGSIWLLCRVYRALGRNEEAQAAEKQLRGLEASFAGDMARIRALSDQASRYKTEGKFDKVAELMEEYLKIRETSEALIRLGDAYLALGRISDARRCYVRASQIGVLNEGLEKRLQRVQELAADKP
jgi:tetratricopeptide (TPR) repeat protein